MRYASVCSGIEAATVAWKNIPGWHPVWFSQYDPEHNYKAGPDFASKVLQWHYPDVPNLGDMLKLSKNDIYVNEQFDLLVGGTPCQSFSLAGLRGGLDDDRGNLALEFCRVLAAKKPRWFVWENVPGVHSSFSDEKDSEEIANYLRRNKRRRSAGGTGMADPEAVVQSSDFARLLEAFQQCGYSVCWRILDSQYFGVPQRRRRVFVVGHIGTDWRPPFAVLFEQQGLRRHSAPGKKEGESVAGKTENSIGSTGEKREAFGGNNTSGSIDISTAIKGDMQNQDFESETFISENISKGEFWYGGQTASTILKSNDKHKTSPDRDNFSAVIQKTTIGVDLDKNAFLENSGTLLKGKRHSNIVSIIEESIGIDEDRNTSVENSGTLRSHQSGGQEHAVAYNITFADANGTRKDRQNGGMYVNETDQATTLKTINDNSTVIHQPLVYNLVQITNKDNRSNPKEGDPAPAVTAGGQPHVVVKEETDVWALSAINSNSMKSDNPNSGFYADTISKTIDTRKPNPLQHQGGNVIHQKKTVEKTTSPTLTKHNLDSRSPQSQTQTQIVEAVHSTTQIIRRLTPLECERLQGFPDNYTLIPVKKVKSKNVKPGIYALVNEELWHLSLDGPRYQAIGNSMTTNVMLWIGQRIDKMDKILKSLNR